MSSVSLVKTRKVSEGHFVQLVNYRSTQQAPDE